MSDFDFNAWLQDYQWEQYKTAKRRAEWDMYANVVSGIGSTIAGGLSSYSNRGYVDVGDITKGIGGVIGDIGSYAGFGGFTNIPPEAQAYLTALQGGRTGIPSSPTGTPGVRIPGPQPAGIFGMDLTTIALFAIIGILAFKVF
jgi:hypothetical protein